jgi:hypothetical protein
MESIEQFQIPTGSKLVLVGKSNVGKTFFMKKMIDFRSTLFEGGSRVRVIFVYKFLQPWFDEYRKYVEFYEKDIPEDINAEIPSLLFIDDLAENEFEKINSWFLRNCRHIKATIIVNYQSLFVNNSWWRSITQNLDFLVLFYTIRSSYQVSLFARQVFGSKEKAKNILDLYQNCINEPFGYLLFDLRPGITYRLRSQIIPDGKNCERAFSF